MHRGFFLPVKAFPPAPNGPGTGGGRCHATYLCGERFNSRPPWGGRQFDVDDESYKAIFQSTPSARRATQKRYQQLPTISIHALREEGDSASTVLLRPHPYFNPRPPRGGRRKPVVPPSVRWKFQSTPSARRATYNERLQKHDFSYFNPRPPRGGRRENPDSCTYSFLFQSTPSARRATSYPGR